jgi:hypothetical protein
MRNIRPSAAPLVIWIRYGVAGWERAPAVQPALEFEIELDDTPVITPETWPVMLWASSIGRENRVFFFAVPEPAAMLTVTKPTGSVVAVVCAIDAGRATAEARDAMRENRRTFIRLKVIQGRESVKDFPAYLTKKFQIV